MPPERTPSFGKQALLGRAGKPAELAGAHVLPASDLDSDITGAVLPVTGGEIMICRRSRAIAPHPVEKNRASCPPVPQGGCRAMKTMQPCDRK